MIVLVCGGRNFTDTEIAYNFLNDLHKQYQFTQVISGGARGADSLADSWPRINDIESIVVPAEWNKFGKAAGHIRNMKMVDEHHPNLVIAFPGGKGTTNMIQYSKRNKIKVIEYNDYALSKQFFN